MVRSQDDLFGASEGDHYFQRNQAAYNAFNPSQDPPLRLLDLYQVNPKSVLEVGCSSGFRLAAIAERHGARVVGCEPSAEAITAGRLRYPRVEFVQGRASALPFDGPFDLIIVNYVFHWVDRSTLLRSVAEVDRVLEDGGFLVLGDFAPMNRHRRPYHHLPGESVFTYKQDYAAVFLASGLYYPVGMLTGTHSDGALRLRVPEDDRGGHWLLRKTLDENYVERSLTRS